MSFHNSGSGGGVNSRGKSELNPKSRLTGADGIRAIACIAVMGHHLFQRLAMQVQTKGVQEIQAFFLMGSAGVGIFFVLSGFLLAYPFWKQYLSNGSFPSIKQYVIRRAARIMPGYYIALTIALLLTISLKVPTEHLLLRYAAGYTFTSSFHFITFFPTELNGALWSIGFEVFSYVLLPVLMFILFKLSDNNRSFTKSMIYWAISLVIIFYINNLIHAYLTPNAIRRGWQYGIVGGAKYWMPNYNPIGFFAHFSLGIIGAGVTTYLFAIPDKLEKFRKFGGFDLIALLALSGAFYILWNFRYAPEFSHSFQSQPYFYPYFGGLISLVLLSAPHTRFTGKILDNIFFRFTSKVSFGLYVWHHLIIGMVNMLLIKDYVYMGIKGLSQWTIISVLILLLSYIIASLSYYLIEKPVLDRAHGKAFSTASKDSAKTISGSVSQEDNR